MHFFLLTKRNSRTVFEDIVFNRCCRNKNTTQETYEPENNRILRKFSKNDTIMCSSDIYAKNIEESI